MTLAKEFEKHKKEQTGYEQGAEKPECAAKEFVVARHIDHNAPKVLTPLCPIVGVKHAMSDIAKLRIFAQYAASEEQIMDDKEKYAPLDEWHIETFDAVKHKGAAIAEIFGVKKVTSTQKENGHMEDVDKVREPSAYASVREYYADDGYRFDQGEERRSLLGLCGYGCLL